MVDSLSLFSLTVIYNCAKSSLTKVLGRLLEGMFGKSTSDGSKLQSYEVSII